MAGLGVSPISGKPYVGRYLQTGPLYVGTIDTGHRSSAGGEAPKFRICPFCEMRYRFVNLLIRDCPSTVMDRRHVESSYRTRMIGTARVIIPGAAVPVQVLCHQWDVHTVACYKRIGSLYPDGILPTWAAIP